MSQAKKMSSVSRQAYSESDEDNNVGIPEFGKYKNVPNIQTLIDFWTKEVELESFRENELQRNQNEMSFNVNESD